MRKMLFLIVTIALFLSCNNDKTSGSKDSKSDTADVKGDNGKIDRNSGKYDDVVDDDEEGNHVSDKGTWSAIDVKLFTKTCENAAVNGGMDRSIAESYCSCMQKKIEAKYPNSEDAGQFDKNSEWAKEMAVECLGDSPSSKTSSKTGWSRREEMEFVDECVPAAMKNGLSELDAQAYCDCMQYKIEKLYPDYAEANRSVDMESPSMKRMVKDCLLEN